MLDLTDSILIHFPSGIKAAYNKYCTKCNTNMGYRLKSKINETKICRSCAHLSQYNHSNEDVLNNKNVDFSVFKIIDGKRCYKSVCVGCNIGRGFQNRSRWSTLCRTCVVKGKVKTEETKIKISCIKQGIEIADFNGFRTPLKKLERENFSAKESRKKCFEEAVYTCKVCSTYGGTLNAHHLTSWHTHPELRFVATNLVCLCNSCHKNFHAKYSYKNNTREQFEEFIGEYYAI